MVNERPQYMTKVKKTPSSKLKRRKAEREAGRRLLNDPPRGRNFRQELKNYRIHGSIPSPARRLWRLPKSDQN